MSNAQEDDHLLQDLLNTPFGRSSSAINGMKSAVSTEQLEPETRDNRSDAPSPTQNLTPLPTRRRILSLFLVFVYGFILIFSWAITCVLAYRPIDVPQWQTSYASPSMRPCYYYQHRGDTGISGVSCLGSDHYSRLSSAQMTRNGQFLRAARFLGMLAAVAAIPLSSTICARAAVAYLQGLPDGPFKLKKTLALADRGWWDPVILTKLLFPRRGRQEGTKFLVLSTIICALGAVFWPLQGVLVGEETIHIIPRNRTPKALTRDADITGVSQVQSRDAISDTTAFINSGSPYDSEPSLWKSDTGCLTLSPEKWFITCIPDEDGDGADFYPMPGSSSFVSNVVNTVNTGLFESHSFRFNSTVSCKNVTDDEFPEPCGGPGSFTASSMSQLESENEEMEFQVCIPSDLRGFPWNITRDRQDIQETLYLRFNSAAMSALTNTTTEESLVRKCVADTSAGYFMLPNTVNPDPGPLLDTFDLATSGDPKTVNVKMATSNDPKKILGEGYPSPNVTDSATQGPLLIAAQSLFGPYTFFSTRANASMSSNSSSSPSPSPSQTNCTQIPFHYMRDEDEPTRPTCASKSPETYFTDLAHWLRNLFASESHVRQVITASVYYANKANLYRAATVPNYHRTVLSDQGTQVQKPTVARSTLVVLSIILALHLLGLGGLAIYTARRPTWTPTLDSWAVLKLGAALLLGRQGREVHPP